MTAPQRYFLYPAQAGVAKFLETFKEFPPAQHPGSFTVEDAHAAVANAAGGANH